VAAFTLSSKHEKLVAAVKKQYNCTGIKEVRAKIAQLLNDATENQVPVSQQGNGDSDNMVTVYQDPVSQQGNLLDARTPPRGNTALVAPGAPHKKTCNVSLAIPPQTPSGVVPNSKLVDSPSSDSTKFVSFENTSPPAIKRKSSGITELKKDGVKSIDTKDEVVDTTSFLEDTSFLDGNENGASVIKSQVVTPVNGENGASVIKSNEVEIDTDALPGNEQDKAVLDYLAKFYSSIPGFSDRLVALDLKIQHNDNEFAEQQQDVSGDQDALDVLIKFPERVDALVLSLDQDGNVVLEVNNKPVRFGNVVFKDEELINKKSKKTTTLSSYFSNSYTKGKVVKDVMWDKARIVIKKRLFKLKTAKENAQEAFKEYERIRYVNDELVQLCLSIVKEHESLVNKSNQANNTSTVDSGDESEDDWE